MENLTIRYNQYGYPNEVMELCVGDKGPLLNGHLRVRMLLSPVNASDLIPVTGAYRHRTTLPSIAGYEGVGVVVGASNENEHMLGKRVLPLRSEGTWQRYVDCPCGLAVPVPDYISSELAARAYINPIAAHLMIQHFSPKGKNVLVTAAGSDCAHLLGQWAIEAGAKSVVSVYRSQIHAHMLTKYGTTPIHQSDTEALRSLSSQADIVYDAVGGHLADFLVDSMREGSILVSYGLLSGQRFNMQHAKVRVYWFHVRNYLGEMATEEWQGLFDRLWPRLVKSNLSPGSFYDIHDWKAALDAYRITPRTTKPVLVMSSHQ